MPETESLSKETVCFKVPAKNINGKQYLVVPEGWEAVCILDAQLGKVLKRGKYKLATLKGKSHLFEVLFYPTLSEFSFLWGTKQHMDFSDPIYSLPVKMGANGKIVFLLKNIRNLYLTSKQGQQISISEIKNQVVMPLVKFLQEKISEYMSENKLSFLEFETNKDFVFKELSVDINFFLQNEFGLKLSNFMVDGIIFDKKLYKTLENESQKQKENEFEEQEEVEKKKNLHMQNTLALQSQTNEVKQAEVKAEQNVQSQIEQKQQQENEQQKQEHQQEQMLLL